MTESVTLTAAGEGGSRAEVVILRFTTADPYQLTALRKGHPEVTYSGSHLTHCLRKFRKDLEAEGLLLCCQGARVDVTLSGMQAQMEGGRFPYTFDAESGRVNKEVVDIFAPAKLEEVATTAVQRAAILDFYGIEDRGEEA